MILDNKSAAGYLARTQEREHTLMKATMGFVGYFMGLGDDQETAEGKVSQVSSAVATYLYVYTLGNTQPLIDAINGISEGDMVFMDSDAKANLIGGLTITT